MDLSYNTTPFVPCGDISPFKSYGLKGDNKEREYGGSKDEREARTGERQGREGSKDEREAKPVTFYS